MTPARRRIDVLLVVAVAAAAVVALLAIAVAGHHRAPLDGAAFDAARDLRGRTGVDVAKGITLLGGTLLTLCLVAVVTGWLAAVRRTGEAVALALGTLLAFGGVALFKLVEDRPRPAGRLVATEGKSFPSGHAVHAVALVVIAWLLTRNLAPRARWAVVAAAVLVAVAVGATRVYLRAHYLSDVVAGWAFAAGAYALAFLGVAAVSRVRHNSSPGA